MIPILSVKRELRTTTTIKNKNVKNGLFKTKLAAPKIIKVSHGTFRNFKQHTSKNKNTIKEEGSRSSKKAARKNEISLLKKGK